MRFIDKVRSGRATFDDFQDAIDAWHKSTSSESVEDYLGISKEDYFALLKNPDYLKKIVNQRVAGSFLDRIKEKHGL